MQKLHFTLKDALLTTTGFYGGTVTYMSTSKKPGILIEGMKYLVYISNQNANILQYIPIKIDR